METKWIGDLGPLSVLREIGHVSCLLDPSVPAEWMVKRIQFFSYELKSLVPVDMDERSKLEALNHFFFEAKGFSIIPENQSLSSYILNRALAVRKAAPTVLSLIYSYLAEQIGLRLQLVDFTPGCFLKYVTPHKTYYLNMQRRGKLISSEELLDILQRRLQERKSEASSTPEPTLEPISDQRWILDYLSALKGALRFQSAVEPLVSVLNVMIRIQPSNVQLFGERAMALKKIGRNKSALADLKRYFAFVEKELAPPEMVRLFDELMGHPWIEENQPQI